MFAILCEHFGGKWPFWLSPRQVMVIAIIPKVHREYTITSTLFGPALHQARPILPLTSPCSRQPSSQYDDYAAEVQRIFHLKGFTADSDLGGKDQLQKKVRNACVAQYNYILVVGGSEEERRTVNVRTRDGKQHGTSLKEEKGALFRRLGAPFVVGVVTPKGHSSK